MPLEPKDKRHLLAAEGYLELGMHLDAVDELEGVSKEIASIPQVLSLWMEVYRGLKKWGAMQAVAEKLAEEDPENVQWTISWAFATRRAESIPAAREILLEALSLHPREALVYYNLACYDCQLKNMSSARDFLRQALELSPNFRGMALEDPDLEPLYPELKAKKL